MPEISIIVPVYNAGRTIEKCVSSLRQQTFYNLEIILVDDGSKDGSEMLCDSYATEDKRIQVIHKKNEGVSAARNRGLLKASGRYVLFVDSDDYLPADYCEKLLCAQKQFGEKTFIWCAIQVISPNGEVAETKYCYAAKGESILSRRDVYKMSEKYVLNSPVNKLYHMDVIKKNKLKMLEDISIAEDLEFNIQYLNCIDNTPIVLLNELCYQYVRYGDISLDNGYRQDYYKIHKRILGKMREYAQNWRVPTEDIPLYYKRYWEYMQTAISNLNRRDCPLTKKQKKAEMRSIIRDPDFQESVKQKKDSMGRASYYSLRSKSLILLYLTQIYRQLS